MSGRGRPQGRRPLTVEQLHELLTRRQPPLQRPRVKVHLVDGSEAQMPIATALDLVASGRATFV